MENKIIDATEKYLDDVVLIENSEIIMPWSKNSLEELLNNNSIVFRVLVDEMDSVIGYYSFAQILDECHINNIAVRKSDQSKGYGTLLMQDMIQEAAKRDIVALTLEVEVENVKAIGLYSKFDFKNEGIRKKYYKNTKDAMIMWRR